MILTGSSVVRGASSFMITLTQTIYTCAYWFVLFCSNHRYFSVLWCRMVLLAAMYMSSSKRGHCYYNEVL